MPLTLESLNSARAHWRQQEISEYDFEYDMNGNECVVTVRDGIVKSLLVNGSEGNSSQLRFFSVDGLFDTLEMDLEAASTVQASTSLMRVRFNPEFGFVERYVRGSTGVAPAAEIKSVVFAVVTESAPG